jgi:hypothetical protein
VGDRSYARVSDEEIAAAVSDELPDREAMATVTSDCGPEEFALAADSGADTIPPGENPEPESHHPPGPAPPEKET